jgi:hypothetical protein
MDNLSYDNLFYKKKYFKYKKKYLNLKRKLPIFLLAAIYDYYTFYELLEIKKIKNDDNDDNFEERIDEIIEWRVTGMENNGIRVPEDCEKLEDAVELVEWHMGRGKYTNYSDTFKGKRFSTIVLGKREHMIEDDHLVISSAMNIVGDPMVPKSEIVVLGGILFNEGIHGNCHLQHMTLRQAKGFGVDCLSSFTMEDVLVEQCEDDGVNAYGTGVVGRCTNVEVRHCGWSGVWVSYGASITLIGAKTTVHNNCTKGDSDEYGLKVWGSSATIQLVSPLSKETCSFDNGGGGNWGAKKGADINQIKTISKADMEAAVAGR